MLTIFTTPKPFLGHFETIQTNAIRSWLSLAPPCEIILFSYDEGTADIASELGISHISNMECNEYGTPLISDMFRIAQEIASNPHVGFVSTDIILMSDFFTAVRSIKKSPFLMVGQRWDVEVDELINFDGVHQRHEGQAHILYWLLQDEQSMTYTVFHCLSPRLVNSCPGSE